MNALSRRRGAHWNLAERIVSTFERGLPGHRRWLKRSNSRMVKGKQTIVRVPRRKYSLTFE